MRTRTFKEIRDFCIADREYREYYDVPEPSRCTREQWDLYHRDRGDGTTYCGTVLYGRSQERLGRFLGQEPPHILLTLDIRTFEVVDENPHNGLGLTVSARVSGFGVKVEFSEPFLGPYRHRTCCFTPVSNRPFSHEGVVAEVKAYCDEHLLLPPGRYRDIQIDRRWPKRHFRELYRKYREMEVSENERRHEEMLTRYAHDRFITDEQAYLQLSAEGMFSDMHGYDEEQLGLAEEYAEDHNRNIYYEIRKHQRNHLP